MPNQASSPAILSRVQASERTLMRDDYTRQLHVPGDVLDLKMIERVRPPSLREYDQIPMRTPDLLRQAQFLAPILAGKRVVFMGDSDCLSLVIGIRSRYEAPCPAEMHLLDFDERLLNTALDVAGNYGFGNVLHGWRYNAFDPVPALLTGTCDVFVTNPPYGKYNRGKSARLFIGRAMELITPNRGEGVIILPDDPTRGWTGQACRSTIQFLHKHGWTVSAQHHAVHKYHLDDDPSLTSDLILVGRATPYDCAPLPFASRTVACTDISKFYGRSTQPPFPRYILSDGSRDFDWGSREEDVHEWRRSKSGFAA